jgi:hypothetical protein
MKIIFGNFDSFLSNRGDFSKINAVIDFWHKLAIF